MMSMIMMMMIILLYFTLIENDAHTINWFGTIATLCAALTDLLF